MRRTRTAMRHYGYTTEEARQIARQRADAAVGVIGVVALGLLMWTLIIPGALYWLGRL